MASLELREATTKKFMALSAENARQATSELFGIQNSLKSQRGRLKGLQDPAMMAKKEAAETRLRAELGEEPGEAGRNWATRGTSSRRRSRWRGSSTPNATSSPTRRA